MKLEVYILINRYNKALDENLRRTNMAKPSGANSSFRKGIETKKRIVNFYESKNKWPSRYSKNTIEISLANSFNSYVAKSNPSHDNDLLKLAIASGHNTKNKRPHNKRQYKQDIIDFISKHGHVPRPVGKNVNDVELKLGKLFYSYTFQHKDTIFLSKVYKIDKCHRSGIPYRFRKFLNGKLEIENPIIRLVK